MPRGPKTRISERSKPEFVHKFKVGDRVSISDDNACGAGVLSGDIGTVVLARKHRESYDVKMDIKRVYHVPAWAFRGDYLLPYSLTPEPVKPANPQYLDAGDTVTNINPKPGTFIPVEEYVNPAFIAEPPKGATKHDAGKPDLSMISLELVTEVAKVRMFGAKKYKRAGWKDGFKVTRSCAAALRHIFLFLSGETNDAESGLSHIAHAVCNLEHLLYDLTHHPENDDRDTIK